MGVSEAGRVLTEAAIENLEDLWSAEQGHIPLDQVRRIAIPDALVDTGATLLSLPTRLIRQLGLKRRGERRVTLAIGPGQANMDGTVRLTIQGRDCPTDVMEVPDAVPVLIGPIPLEYLDLVVDPRSQRLIGIPAHGGELTYEIIDDLRY